MTFSILATDGETLGVGVVSGSTAVGDRVPWVEEGVGAIATQGYTETEYGRKGLSLLEEGLDPSSTLEKLLREDRAPEKRQAAIMSLSGEKAVHTGSSCPEERDSGSWGNGVSIGNMLERKRVIPEMVEAFRDRGSLFSRIMRALESGADAGGDRRGNRAAAVLIEGEENVDIGIDMSEDPLEDLKNEYEG